MFMDISLVISFIQQNLPNIFGIIIAILIYQRLKPKIKEYSKKVEGIEKIINFAMALIIVHLIFPTLGDLLNLFPVDRTVPSIIKSVDAILSPIFTILIVYFAFLIAIEILISYSQNIQTFIGIERDLIEIISLAILLAAFIYFGKVNEVRYATALIVFSFLLLALPIFTNFVKSVIDRYMSEILLKFGIKYEFVSFAILAIFLISYTVAVINLVSNIFDVPFLRDITSVLLSINTAIGNVIWYSFLISLTIAALVFASRR